MGICTFPNIGDCMGFPELKICEKEQNLGIICVSHTCSIRWGFTHFHSGISVSREICKKPLTLECLCFPMFFLTMGINLSHVMGIAWISASREICKRNPLLWDVCVFLYFSHTMTIRFPHVLEIAWISASRETFNKRIIL